MKNKDNFNTNNYNNNNNKKSRPSSLLKDKTTSINLAKTRNNKIKMSIFPSSITPNNYKTNIYTLNKKNLDNPIFELILNKLLKYIKKSLSNEIYNDIKNFIKNELDKFNPFLSKNESENSVFSLIKKSSQNSVTHTTTSNNKKENEKKLKLSYDFSNIFNSPNNQHIKIELKNPIKKKFPTNINKNNSNKNIKSKSKNKNIKKTLNISKDMHSLYSIIKPNSNRHNTKLKIDKNIMMKNKTQSNSKSKSKSKNK